MSEADHRRVLADRVASLSSGQRRALSEHLGASARGGPELVAFVTTPAEPLGAEELRAHLSERLPPYMVPARFLRVDELPRTRAGKLRRSGPFPVGTELEETSRRFVAPRTDAERVLARIWGEVLGVDEVGVHDDFFEVGGDSLLSIRVLSRAAREGIEVAPEDFFADPTIARMATLGRPAEASGPADPVVDEAPPTPIQQWFFDRIGPGWSRWNQSVFLDLAVPTDTVTVQKALRRLVLHHDALRACFPVRNGVRLLSLPEPSTQPTWTVVELDGADDGDARIRDAVEAAQASLDIEAGPLFHALLFSRGAECIGLGLVAHHLVVDQVSFGIVLDDLAVLLAADDPLQAPLPPKTLSLTEWSRRLSDAADAPEADDWARYWTGTSGAAVAIDLPPSAPDAGAGTVASAGTVHRETPVTVSDAVSARARGGVGVQEALLAAVVHALGRAMVSEAGLLDVEAHGRDVLPGADLSRTVGWLTTVFPLHVRPEGAREHHAVEAVRAALAEVPLRGASHGLLRYTHRDRRRRDAMAARPVASILFNYLGSLDDPASGDAPFTVSRRSPAPERDPRAPRAYPIEINVGRSAGRFAWTIEFSTERYARGHVEAFAASVEDALRALVEEDAMAPADDLVDLDDEAWARVAGLLDEIDGEA